MLTRRNGTPYDPAPARIYHDNPIAVHIGIPPYRSPQTVGRLAAIGSTVDASLIADHDSWHEWGEPATSGAPLLVSFTVPHEDAAKALVRALADAVRDPDAPLLLVPSRPVAELPSALVVMSEDVFSEALHADWLVQDVATGRIEVAA